MLFWFDKWPRNIHKYYPWTQNTGSRKVHIPSPSMDKLSRKGTYSYRLVIPANSITPSYWMLPLVWLKCYMFKWNSTVLSIKKIAISSHLKALSYVYISRQTLLSNLVDDLIMRSLKKIVYIFSKQTLWIHWAS